MMKKGKGKNSSLLPNSFKIISSCLKTVWANATNVASFVRSAGASVAASISSAEDDKDQIVQDTCFHDTETIMEMGPIQEPEPLGLADSIFEVDFVHSQEFPSQCQVPIPSLEPSRRCQKESLAVINDLSCDVGCVIGKTIGSICDSELGQDNSLDEEEFKGLKLGKLSKNERRLSIVCLLGIMDKSCWTQFPSLRKANEMSLRERAWWKRSEKQRTYNKAWKFKYVQRFMSSVLLQNEQHKLLEGRNIKCKMKKMEVLRRLKHFIFIEVQFHMERNSERMLLELVNFQANTRILELIKDKASRKRKLHKNWWFKYKLNTWLSEALHLWWKETKSREFDRLSAWSWVSIETWHCVKHETQQTDFHVWHRWKSKAEKLPADYAV